MKKNLDLIAFLLLAAFSQTIHATLTQIENEEQLKKIISAKEPSVVLFYADWCGSCVKIKEPLEKVTNNDDFKHITFVKIDVDKHQSLAREHHVNAIPTLLFFKDNKKVNELIGSESEENLSAHIKSSFTNNKKESTTPVAESQEESVTPSIFQRIFNRIWCTIIMLKNMIINIFSMIKNMFTSRS